MSKELRIETTAEMNDLREFIGDRLPTKEEAFAAARFLIMISAPRRNAKARAEDDAREGLRWLSTIDDLEVPPFWGSGRQVAERIRDWFESTFEKQGSAPRKTLVTNAAECRSTLAPVYRRYSGQPNPQPAFLELDVDERTLMARHDPDHDPESDGPAPKVGYNGRTFRFGISPYLLGEFIANILEDDEVRMLVNRIIDGQVLMWDGRKRVRVFTEVAANAFEHLQKLLNAYSNHPAALVTVKDVKEWLPTSSEARVTADTTDDRLRELVVELMSEAADEDVLLEGGLFTWLATLRDRVRRGIE